MAAAPNEPSILRPKPKHPWQLTPLSTEPPTPRSRSIDPSGSAASTTGSASNSADVLSDLSSSKPPPPPRSRSILNLTSSTLFGIYSGSTADGSGSSREDVSAREDASIPGTPWGTGAATPVSYFGPTSREALASSLRNLAEDRKPPTLGPWERTGGRRRAGRKRRESSIWTGLRNALLLFALGAAYGVVVTNLHEHTAVAPVKLEGIERHRATYFLFWGCAGAGMGLLLPWLDRAWSSPSDAPGEEGEEDGSDGVPGGAKKDGEENPTDWFTVMRGVGAFVGIAFAIRHLPWESTLQASLTLALSNPVLWYLVDRSATGFLLALGVGLTGTAADLGSNPEYVPAPAAAAAAMAARLAGFNSTGVHAAAAHMEGLTAVAALVNVQSMAASTWVASVLFYCCVCFGNIGRVLAFR